MSSEIAELRDAETVLLLEAYSKAELARLTEKAALMRSGRWNEIAKADDTAWRNRNREILASAESRVQK